MKNLQSRIYTSPFSTTVIALVFALLCTGIQSFELWQNKWEVVEGKKAPVTVRLPATYFRITLLRNEVHYLNTTSSSCPKMIGRGVPVNTGTECSGLVSAFEEARRPVRPTRLLGLFVFYLMIGILLSTYMRREGMGRARWLRSQVSVFLLIVLITIGSKMILLFTVIPFEILPIAAVPLFAVHFLGRRLCFGVAMASAMVACSLLNFDIQALLIFFVSGASSVLVYSNRHRIRVIFKSSVAITVVSLIAIVLTTLLFSGTLNIYDDASEHLHPYTSIWLAGIFSCLSSGLIVIILSPILGIMVGEVSQGKLLDLQDFDHPLLKRLRKNAPSTWEHSRAMANLGEAATHAIGGNAMLVRVGAYFHDVGKSLKPEYFIENQAGCNNPHDQMEPFDSAKAIFQHVVEGTKLLRRENVPEDIIEFAYSHHGTSVLEFFWNKNLENGNPQELNEQNFAYPGHKPTTRETAILMIVDAIEAAARTVDEPDKSKFEVLLQRIVFFKMAQGQFDESGLSISDIRIVMNTVIDTLVSMHHARIKYPWQTDEKSINNSHNKSTSEIAVVIDSRAQIASDNVQIDQPVTVTEPFNLQPTVQKAEETQHNSTTYTGPAPTRPNK